MYFNYEKGAQPPTGSPFLSLPESLYITGAVCATLIPETTSPIALKAMSLPDVRVAQIWR